MRYPPDLEHAMDVWNATCGPCALAALLGVPVQRVRHLFPGYHGWVTPTQMQRALAQTRRCRRYQVIQGARPTQGLIFLQWGGHEEKPIRAQYTYTHWVAVEGDRTFDFEIPRLVTWTQWQRMIPTRVQKAGRGDGTFFVRLGIEIEVGR